MNTALHFSSAMDTWNTPPALMGEIATFLGVFYDPCPAHPDHDALALPCWPTRVYMNPPYGREIGRWVARAQSEATDELIMLLPARTDTTWFQPLFVSADVLCFVRGRLHFSGHKNAAPFPSVLVYRGPRAEVFRVAFAHYGHLVRLSGGAE
ncbi:MAG TPA: DNA N-6-adenine-methyltransferase [Ktedonobacterales bacterium]|nr:DNA N-6-adenine-methyltransferase [Ktedonobacterales bacterium]